MCDDYVLSRPSEETARGGPTFPSFVRRAVLRFSPSQKSCISTRSPLVGPVVARAPDPQLFCLARTRVERRRRLPGRWRAPASPPAAPIPASLYLHGSSTPSPSPSAGAQPQPPAVAGHWSYPCRRLDAALEALAAAVSRDAFLHNAVIRASLTRASRAALWPPSRA